MDERAPTPAAVAQLAMDDLVAASAKLAVSWQPRRPDASDAFFRAPESRSLLVRISRDNPPLPLGPLRRIEREESKLSLGFSLGAHARPASSSAAQRSAAGPPEVRRPAAPPIRVLMAGHHRPRATRVRIPYAPPSPAWTGANRDFGSYSSRSSGATMANAMSSATRLARKHAIDNATVEGHLHAAQERATMITSTAGARTRSSLSAKPPFAS
jgi:hypothetical protein